ncbi:hypothetical protein OB920_15320 [Halobacteria archaeon HArc-gm2]|nr:hypothetical protein [Halobacteria archaeon HArc-gm2]
MERPVDRVLAAVAAAEETDPLSLQPPLGEVVDADALNALVTGSQDRSGADVTVQFTYRGHDVTVGPDGDVTIGPDGDVTTGPDDVDLR